MPDTINTRNSFSIDRKNLNRIDKFTLQAKDFQKKVDVSDPLLSYHASTLASLADPLEEDEGNIRDAVLPVLKVSIEQGILTKMYAYARQAWGFIYSSTKSVPLSKEVQAIRPAYSTEGLKKRTTGKPVSSLPRLQAPEEIDPQQLAFTMSSVNEWFYRLKKTSDDWQHQEIDSNQPCTLVAPKAALLRRSKAKNMLTKKKPKENSINPDPIGEARLYTEFVQLILKEKNLSEETLKILSHSISLITQTNKTLEKLYFNFTDEKIKRNKILKVAKWVEGILTGCLIGGSIAGVAASIASGGAAVLFVMAALQATGSLSDGSATMLQAVLQHKNRKALAALYGISLERHQNTKQVEIIFGEFKHALDQVRFSWEELVKLLQQRRRAGKIEV